MVDRRRLAHAALQLREPLPKADPLLLDRRLELRRGRHQRGGGALRVRGSRPGHRPARVRSGPALVRRGDRVPGGRHRGDELSAASPRRACRCPTCRSRFFITLTDLGGVSRVAAVRRVGASSAARAAGGCWRPPARPSASSPRVPSRSSSRRWCSSGRSCSSADGAACKRRTSALAAALFVLVAAPWYVAMTSRARHRLPPRVLHRRQPRALRDDGIQRAPADLLLRAHRPRRHAAVVALLRAARGAGRARVPAAEAAPRPDVRVWCWAAGAASCSSRPRSASSRATSSRCWRPSLCCWRPPSVAPSRRPPIRARGVPSNIEGRYPCCRTPSPAVLLDGRAVGHGGRAHRPPALARASAAHHAACPPGSWPARRRWALAGLAVVVLAVSRALAADTGDSRGAPRLVFVLVLRYVVVALPDLDPVEQMAGRVLAHRVAGGARRVLPRVRPQPRLLHAREAGRPR